MTISVMVMSTLLQYFASYLALRLIYQTANKNAWWFISVAIVLMAARRSIILYQHIAFPEEFVAHLPTELVALTISAMMTIGLYRIAPLFGSIAQSEKRAALLEEQLQQSQKMESIGLLAGGVAHDFNNLLMVINGYGAMAMEKLKPSDQAHQDLQEIVSAGKRAAELTRQLLAFSRKQFIEPQIIDLNAAILNIKKMLRRLIGEDIELATTLEPNLPSIKVDPAQMEQIIMNLIVNSRDAMPKGGTITIETQSVFLEKSYISEHLEAKKGRYVMLVVSDTGQGIEKDIQQRVFEPFFTTKGRHRGTGLGLSTVYGIVKQSDGFINLYSEPGMGTTFKIYYPQCAENAQPEQEETDTFQPIPGSETILVVEDDGIIRNLICRILRENKFIVYEAGNGEQGLQFCKNAKSPIHLILTDVVMPGVNGIELANQAKSIDPRIKIIYMSGFTDDTIVHHGMEANVAFLQKPIMPKDLVQKVREVLDVSSSNGLEGTAPLQ